MSSGLFGLGNLIAVICFILALKSFSLPIAGHQGRMIAMIGLSIAILVTLLNLTNAGFASYMMILLALLVGGGIGIAVIRKFQAVAAPVLMISFQSLVGMTAVLIAAAALNNPYHFGITDDAGHIFDTSLLKMGLGAVFGGSAFSGSIVAFGKSQGVLPLAPVFLPSRHVINIGLGVVIILLLMAFMATASQLAFWMMTILAFVIGFLIIMPIGDTDMPVAISMLNAHSGWATASIGFMLSNPILIVAGALIGSSSTFLARNMCKAMHRSFVSVILEGSPIPASTTPLKIQG